LSFFSFSFSAFDVLVGGIFSGRFCWGGGEVVGRGADLEEGGGDVRMGKARGLDDNDMVKQDGRRCAIMELASLLLERVGIPTETPYRDKYTHPWKP